MTDTFHKDPSAVLDYRFDWSEWLAQGESIVSTQVISTAGLTVGTVNHDANSVTAWLSGGTNGIAYAVTCHITTDSAPVAREDDRTIYIVCGQR